MNTFQLGLKVSFFAQEKLRAAWTFCAALMSEFYARIWSFLYKFHQLQQSEVSDNVNFLWINKSLEQTKPAWVDLLLQKDCFVSFHKLYVCLLLAKT